MTKLTNVHVVGIVASGAFLIVAAFCLSGGDKSESSAPATSSLSATDAWEAAQPQLKQADDVSAKLAERRAQQVNEYFKALAGGGHLEEFIDEALSFGAKVKFVSQGSDSFSNYLTDLFRKKVFPDSDLDRLFAEIIAGYQKDLDACDNKLLIELHADTDSVSANASKRMAVPEQMRRRIAEACDTAVRVAADDILPEICRQVASFFVMQAATDISSNLLTGSGIFDEGLGNTLASNALGLVVGFAVDNMIEQATSPRESILQSLQMSLNEVRNAARSAVARHLSDLARQRAVVRRQIVAQVYGVSP